MANADLTFERDVRPILKANCFHCHGEGDELAGGLDLRLVRQMKTGGDSGPAVVSGQADRSLLVARLRADEMPPEEVKKRLTPEEISRLEAWIAAGAKTAAPEPEKIQGPLFTDEERQFWAFQPIRRPAVPRIKDPEVAARARAPIDDFLLEKLVEKGLSFNADADRQVLIRRVYLDLLGLPPTPEEAAAFLADKSPDAYERLVDRLLASPHFGERWGRHWLDVAGYADSEGGNDEDVVRTDAFPYRDYVIRSLNANLPLDEFIVEQLAGDELILTNWQKLQPDQVNKLVATGFLRMAPDGTAAEDADQTASRNQVVADTLEIVTSSLLGLTVACAQCHNHRYDPISQADYYRLRAIFEPALNWKDWRTPPQRRVSLLGPQDRQRSAEIEAEAKLIEARRLKKEKEFIQQTLERELAKLPAELHETLRKVHETPPAKQTAAQKQLLQKYPSINVTSQSLYLYDKQAAAELKQMADEAAKLRETKPVDQPVRALTEPAGQSPPVTFLFHRGDPEQPKEELTPGELTILTLAQSAEKSAMLPIDDPDLPTTGRRLAYARWLTSGQHPLVPRVLANRVWLQLFGRGIVQTPADFGYLGARPSHPELLDWLADELVASGWDLKHMVRLLITSTAYRQSSVRDSEHGERDPDNLLFGRKSIRRLDAESLRDGLLFACGQLNFEQYGPPIPVMADEVGQFVVGIENLDAGRPRGVIQMKGEDLRRSIYIQVRRSRPLGVLDTFDGATPAPNCTVRSSSTVAPQSLMLMNSGFIIEQADQFARRVLREAGSDFASQIDLAWQIAYARKPNSEEATAARTFLADLREQLLSRSAAKTAVSAATQTPESPADDADLAVLTRLCHALLSSNEFLYVD